MNTNDLQPKIARALSTRDNSGVRVNLGPWTFHIRRAELGSLDLIITASPRGSRKAYLVGDAYGSIAATALVVDFFNRNTR